MNEIEELRLAVSALSTQLADAKETYEHIAEAVGCAERVWGQSGVMVASEEGLLRDIKEMRQAWEQLAEAKADAEDWKQVSRDWRARAESAERRLKGGE